MTNNIWKKFDKGVMAAAMISVAALASCSKADLADNHSNPVSSQSQLESNRYFVTFKDNATATASAVDNGGKAAQLVNAAGDIFNKDLAVKINITPENTFTLTHTVVVELSKEQVEQLRKDPNVKSIEQDKIEFFGKPVKSTSSGTTSGTSTTTTTTTTSTSTTTQPAQTTPWGITAVGGATDGTGKTAWIIDSGIDPSHPDLNVDGSRSKSFLQSTDGGNWSSYADEYGHGTMVAGIIGARNNSIGVVGVAAGANLVSLKVGNYAGSIHVSYVASALQYVSNYGHAGDVVNLSMGFSSNLTIQQYIMNLADKGIKVVSAAGNSNMDCSTVCPANINYTNVYTVSAMTNQNIFWSGSNYGAPVDYTAPGQSIYTTTMGGGYGNGSGTSFASPHLAGILLAKGSVTASGYVAGDPDGKADPIAHE